MSGHLKRDQSHSPTLMRQVVLCTTNGTRRSHTSRRVSHDASQQSHQLGEKVKCLADAFCNSLLRNRTYGDSFESLRFGKVRCGSIPFQSKASRFDDCSGENFSKDDASSATHLSADDGTKMGHLNGSVCFNWRGIRHLCSRSRGRSIFAGRYLRSGLPTKTRNAHRGSHGHSTHYRRGQHPLRYRWQQRASGFKFFFARLKRNQCYNQCLVVINNVRQLSSENHNV